MAVKIKHPRDARMDESMGERRSARKGKASERKARKDTTWLGRRKESRGMEKALGRRPDSALRTIDKAGRPKAPQKQPRKSQGDDRKAVSGTKGKLARQAETHKGQACCRGCGHGGRCVAGKK